jgi:hypothetical protein
MFQFILYTAFIEMILKVENKNLSSIGMSWDAQKTTG